MTEENICRYKFQNNEKFNGKEYCTLFNEVCSDVEFVCDKNCQVYEDYKQLKQAENTVNECHKYLAELEDKIERLEQELKWANDEEKYLKDCCIKAGKELEKYSFKWDGKEKNLVVQAMQLNEQYERLEQELYEWKKDCEKCKLFDIEKTNRDLLERIDKLEQENKEIYENGQIEITKLCNEKTKYHSALEEIREIANAIISGKHITNDIEEHLKELSRQIINKINEVLT